MKKLIFISILMFVFNFGVGQSCYIQLDDISGFDTTPYVSDLESAACDLIQAFPSEVQDSFKVYDFGFYSLNEYMDASYPDVWDNVVQDIENQSKYYLVFGKQSDNSGIYTKFWVKLKLPSTGEFSCMDLISSELRQNLENKLNLQINNSYAANDKSPSEYWKSEIDVISYLTDFVTKTVDCCDPLLSARSTSGCSACIYSPMELLQTQKSKQMIFDFVFVGNDPDWETTGTLNRSSRSTNPLNITIDFGDENIVDLDQFVEDVINDELADISNRFGLTPSVSIHKFKYPRDCGQFENKWSAYENDGAELKFFISFNNTDNKFGVLGFHTISNFANAVERSNGDDQDLIDQEIAELQEISESSGTSCTNLAFAVAELAGSSQYLASDRAAFMTAEELYYVVEAYKKASENYNNAVSQFNIYWEKEYVSVKRSYDDWDECWFACTVRAKWRTTTKLCNGTFHTLLDICGLIPVAGIACDGVNAVSYFLQGDLLNASLSGVALIPVLGYGGAGVKYIGKFRPCLTGLRSGGLCGAIASVTITKGGKLIWKLGYEKLINLMRASKGIVYFNGKIINPSLKAIRNGKEIFVNVPHHVFPWELVNHLAKEPYLDKLSKALARTKWHPSFPDLNGYVIPKYLVSGPFKGRAFHGSHAQYNNWMRDIGKKIQKDLSDIPTQAELDILYTRMQKLTKYAKEQIDVAWKNQVKLNEHFRDLFNNHLMELDDLDKLSL